MRSLRKIPPVCLVISLLRLIVGKLRFSKKFIGDSVKMYDGREFIIFRHIRMHPLTPNPENAVFIVNFKFAKLSHKANKIASILPMLLITGFPGFMTKMYAVNLETGYWQGMYQWESLKHLEEYKKSFVFRMMNKRAIKESIQSYDITNQQLTNYINSITTNNL